MINHSATLSNNGKVGTVFALGDTTGTDPDNNDKIYGCTIIDPDYSISGDEYVEIFKTTTSSTNDTSMTGVLTLPHRLIVDELEYPVKMIGNDAFCYCSSITSVELPNSIVSIGNYAFNNCSSLSSITIPDSVESIGYVAFSKTGLVTITIPNGVTIIEAQTFDCCSSLQTINLPASVNQIKYIQFNSCPSLLNINVDSENTEYKSVDGILLSKDGKTLYQYPAAKSATNYTIPNDVENIPYSAFNGNSYLNTITIGQNVSSISSDAFYNATALTAINVNANNNTYQSIDGVLYSKVGKTLIRCPQGKSGAFAMQSSVERVEESAFRACSFLTSLILSSNINYIGLGAFSGLNNEVYTIETIATGKTLSYLGTSSNSHFALVASGITGYNGVLTFDCDTIIIASGGVVPGQVVRATGIVLPDGLKYICDNNLAPCNKVTSITIPDSVEYIGKNCFTALGNSISYSEDMIIDNGKYVGYRDAEEVFHPIMLLGVADKTQTTFEVPEGVKFLGRTSCVNSSFTSVVLPSTIKKFDNAVFGGCNSLETVKIKAQVPPDIEDGVLFPETIQQIYVPAGTKSAYLAADRWKDLSPSLFFEYVDEETNSGVVVDIVLPSVVIFTLLGMLVYVGFSSKRKYRV